MVKSIDMKGERRNFFTVVAEAGNNNAGQKLWLCRCDCGNEKLITGIRLRHKPPLSCGCDLKKSVWAVGGVRENSGRKPVPLLKRMRYTIDINGCWIWRGSDKNNSGYGRVYYNNKYIGAHRGSYIAHKGAIPDGLLVLHKCDVKKCINPDHLFLGTYSDNMQDMLKKGRGRYQNGQK